MQHILETMFDTITLSTIAVTFLLAGAVKGIIGLGLPVVSLGVLAALLDLPTAMTLLIVPSFVTNLYQASVGGHLIAIFQRIWLFLVTAMATVWLGAAALTTIDLEYLTALLGLLLATYGMLNLIGFRPVILTRHEKWMGPAFGLANGILTGMTGSFMVPGVMYLQGIGLSRNELVQAMGMLFTASTVALALALGTNAILSLELSAVSALAVIPSLVGMAAGQYLREYLSDIRFNYVFFSAIFLLGTYIFVGSFR